jgi:predicted nuclease with TOPRIM domain
MHQQLHHRLQQLQQEYQKGEQQLKQLDQERRKLYETMLRITGAIQVLEEEIGKAEGQEAALEDPEEIPTEAN